MQLWRERWSLQGYVSMSVVCLMESMCGTLKFENVSICEKVARCEKYQHYNYTICEK